jgi:hypothetical protein
MADDLKRRQPEDRKRISLTEKWEVAYWSKALGITPNELKAAVEVSGHSVAAVRKYLKNSAARGTRVAAGK